MKKLELEAEIAALKLELKALKTKSKPHKKAKPIDTDLKQVLEEVMNQVKTDYEKISPVTVLLLFTLGALLGGALSGRKGGKS